MTWYSDADYACDEDTRVSTSGYVVMVGGTAVSWRSKKQKLVTTSSSEADYVAANLAAKELLYVRNIMMDLCINVETPMKLFEDNKAYIAITQREGFNGRTNTSMSCIIILYV